MENTLGDAGSESGGTTGGGKAVRIWTRVETRYVPCRHEVKPVITYSYIPIIASPLVELESKEVRKRQGSG